MSVENNPKSASGSSFQKHLISFELAEQLSKEYLKNNYETINKTREKSKPDAREVIFDLDVLVDYLQYVKSNAKEQGVKNPKIKIVFGQYPKDKVIDPRQNEKYLGYQTVYMFPDFGYEGSTGRGDEQASATTGTDGLNFGGIRPPY